MGEIIVSQLKGKIAIVTGVSRLKGIGAAICKELADSGYHIFLLIGRNMIKNAMEH